LIAPSPRYDARFSLSIPDAAAGLKLHSKVPKVRGWDLQFTRVPKVRQDSVIDGAHFLPTLQD
jgi:hypothetical protein